MRGEIGKLITGEDMRLFAAINFDRNVLQAITDLQESLKQAGVRGRYAPPENLHMTLAFIGEYNDPDDILEIMEQIPFSSFSIKVKGLQHFRDMYFARVEECKELSDYVRRLRRAFSDRGIPFDRKKFSPHITLARRVSFKGDHPDGYMKMPNIRIDVNHISLMRSDRGKHGMIYTEMGRVTGSD